MKAKIFFLSTFFLSVILFSCSDPKEEETGGGGNGGGDEEELSENEKINEWIYDEMIFRYYWNDKIKEESKLDFTLPPAQFFYTTLFDYTLPTGDRFSYLENDGIYQKPEKPQSDRGVKANELGFEYYTNNFTDIGYTYCIVYVKKGTDAEAKGLKRGDVIYKVNNQRITASNYGQLLDSGASQFEVEFYGRSGTVTFNTTKNYAENPLFYSKVLDDRKTGYVVYNFFANGKDETSYDYAQEVNDVFLDFEKKGVTNLILDLRYNSGGYVESGNYIASAIVPNRGAEDRKIYTTREFNKDYDAYIKKALNEETYQSWVTEFFQDYINKDKNHAIARMNIQKLYVITSEYTASASEQIINGLNPYINNLQVVGLTTYGKNMESYTISSSDESIKWVLHPLTSKSFNSKGESNYSLGFDPTMGLNIDNKTGKYADDEFQYHLGDDGAPALYPLGDEREALLAIALDHISGRSSRSLSAKTKQSGIFEKIMPIGSSIQNKRNDMIISPR